MTKNTNESLLNKSLSNLLLDIKFCSIQKLTEYTNALYKTFVISELHENFLYLKEESLQPPNNGYELLYKCTYDIKEDSNGKYIEGRFKHPTHDIGFMTTDNKFYFMNNKFNLLIEKQKSKYKLLSNIKSFTKQLCNNDTDWSIEDLEKLNCVFENDNLNYKTLIQNILNLYSK